jgi:hypothetical protein
VVDLQVIEQASAVAARRFASWDSARFVAWAAGPVAAVWALDPPRGADLLELVAEGIGRGLLGPLDQRPWGWLDGVLRGPLLVWLQGLAPAARAQLLVDVWNLGEGAALHARWVDHYLLARLPAFSGPERLKEELVGELEPLLGEPPPAPWRGPYRLNTLDLSLLDDHFLPGPMTFVGPRILAVADRRRESVVGLLLGPGEPSMLGPLDLPAQDLASLESPPPAPVSLRWEPGRVLLGGQVVALPHLLELHEMTSAIAGHVVASAVDSQRLWVLSHV